MLQTKMKRYLKLLKKTLKAVKRSNKGDSPRASSPFGGYREKYTREGHPR